MAIRASLQQVLFLAHEVAAMVNERWWRWLTVWISPSFGAVASYRLDRAGYLLCGSAWVLVRVLFLPMFLLLRALGTRCEIHYRAQIGPGLMILHPTLGIVVSGNAVIGQRLLLTGGNCIGLRAPSDAGALVLGDEVSLGANAVILGPVRIGHRVRIGAGAVVLHDVPDDQTIVGGGVRALELPAPASPISRFTA